MHNVLYTYKKEIYFTTFLKEIFVSHQGTILHDFDFTTVTCTQSSIDFTNE